MEINETTLKELKTKMGVIQTEFMQKKIPIIAIFEGWSAAGKGTVISQLINRMDPRGYNVFSIEPELESRFSPLCEMYETLPPYGNMSVLDGSWYTRTVASFVREKISTKQLNELCQSTTDFERALANDGYIILKFFLDIPKEEQKKRMDELKDKKSTAWRVKEFDEYQNDHYFEFKECYETVMERTDTAFSPWIKVSATNKQDAVYSIFNEIISAIERANAAKQVPQYPFAQNIPTEPTKGLDGCDLNAYLPKDEYKGVLKDLQKKITKLQTQLYIKKIPVVVAYEGWDAAGKGGNIRRLSSALDPRGFDVIPIAAPSEADRAHHYMWRFWKNLPKSGHTAIFDRTWYGRVMVERIEGFCSEAEWKRAFEEINEFETYLAKQGHVVLKFFINIDADEQLRRFEARRDTPEKSWKLTDEDWRNREKWDVYYSAVSEMIERTNTEQAPWHVIASNDKSYARIKVLSTVAKAFEKALDDA